MNVEKIDKCPMCRSEKTTVFMDVFVSESAEDTRYRAMCRSCGLMTAQYITEAEAVAAWNRRADETDALKAALKDMWFAYTNKDENGLPHGFEIQAIEQAERILGEYDESHVEDITGLQQNQLDHGMFLSAQDEPTCCGKCKGSEKPSEEDITKAVNTLGQRVHKLKNEGKRNHDTKSLEKLAKKEAALSRVIGWLRKEIDR